MTGWTTLVRLALRRDRILLPVWVFGLVLMVSSSVSATKGLYSTEAARITASGTINATGALVALYGRIYDPTSLGALSLIKLTAFGAAVVGIVFAQIVVRHTRNEEETGRLELLQAGVVGRAAPLAAALSLAWAAAIVLGLLTSLGLLTTGLPLGGCLTFGLAWTTSGVFFASLGAVVAQVVRSGRAALGLSIFAVGLAYVLRAIGDVNSSSPGLASWFSPVGWSQQLRPFAGDRIFPAIFSVAAAMLLVALAFVLNLRRDLGSALLPDRDGPAVGRLRGSFALAWRLQRSTLFAYVATCALMGAALGSMASNIGGLLNSPQLKVYLERLGGQSGLVNAFLAAEVSVLTIAIAGFTVTSSNRLSTEESEGRAELLLATALSRTKWVASHFAMALVGSAATLLAAGAAIGLTRGLATNDLAGETVRLMLAAAAQFPAVAVVGALALAANAWIPRGTTAAFAIYIAFVVLGEFGNLWRLPQWLMDLSPFAHSPRVPGGPVSGIAFLGLGLVAIAAAAVAFIGWRRRDISA